MTDFLTGLLDRALDRAPVMERRRHSLFEPAPENLRLRTPLLPNVWQQSADEPTREFEIAPTREPAGWRVPAPSRTGARGKDAPNVHSESLETQPASKPAIAAVPDVSAIRELNRPAETKTPERESPIVGKPLPAPRRAEIVEKRLVEDSRRALPANHTKQHESGPTAANSLIRTKIETVSARPGADSESPRETRKLATETSRQPQPSSAPAAKVVPQPLFAAPRGSRSLRAPAVTIRETHSAPPAVRVTIGRIEVRATSPAAAPGRAARNVTPKLNLQDYLRSRGGDAR
jgi:hypothetical protein